jgi:hypothetical protein
MTLAIKRLIQNLHFAYSYILNYIFFSHSILFACLLFSHFFIRLHHGRNYVWVCFTHQESVVFGMTKTYGGFECMRQKSSLRNSCYSTFSSDVRICFCFVRLQNRSCHIICFFMYTVQFPSYFLRVYKRVQKGYKRVKKKRVFFLSAQFTLL